MDKLKVCKWLYADWCHCPPDPDDYNAIQEKCPYYAVNQDQTMCSSFEQK